MSLLAYDVVLEDLPERMQELVLRLRDVVLSLGSGIQEHVKDRTLEFGIRKVFLRLVPDTRGVTVELPGIREPMADVEHRGLTYTGKGAVIRLVTTGDLGDPVRRAVRAAHVLAQAEAGKGAATPSAPRLAPALEESLSNLSRGLRLWMHQLEVAQKAADNRARSAEKAGQRRSHKKKPPAAAPRLVVADTPPESPRARPTTDAPPRKAPAPKAPARRTPPARPSSTKGAPKKAPSSKAVSSKAVSSKAVSSKASSTKAASTKPGPGKAQAKKGKPTRSPAGKPAASRRR